MSVRALAVVMLLSCSRAPNGESPTLAGPAPIEAKASPVPAGPATASSSAAPVDDRIAEIREQLRTRLEELGSPAVGRFSGEALIAGETLPVFYELRAYVPAWVDGNGPTGLAREAMAALGRAARHGLHPQALHQVALERLIASGDPDERVALELLLSDAVLAMAVHLVHGRVDPVEIHPQWTATGRALDIANEVEDAISRASLTDLASDLAPPQAGYRRLLEALERQRQIVASGGWPKLPAGDLGPKSRGRAVEQLRARLVASGDLDAGRGDRFDTTLADAVGSFQARHGIGTTGTVDAATLAALNVSAERRARQIEANLERWRWLPDDLGKPHVLVNIAGFEAFVVGRDADLRMKAIVGKTYRKTPVFSDRITHVVVNPRWSVPNKLAVRDILPQVQKDPGYLAKKGLRVFSMETGAEKEVDPSSIDWSRVSARKFPYKLRQRSGEDNALGRFKFLFPNQYDVYMHDTPKRDLFGWSERALSSGCIRLERPLDLAELLLRDDPKWSRDALKRAVTSGVEQTIWLAKPVPVHLLYWTAWVEEDGTMQFRKDLYGRDAALLHALDATPTKPEPFSRRRGSDR